ncbi:hypothetical protein M9Y10_003855 [Tritrichomonas musculus]|uniref:DUF3447 domain-containing protein n=1 Tax=Tritrichomonas musculus TaxID=1915356 RepID=A0ABR2JQG1_9EUKA
MNSESEGLKKNQKEYDEYLKKMKSIQEKLLEFIDNDENSQTQIKNLNDFFKEKKIDTNQNELNNILHMISVIEENRHRNRSFFKNISLIFEILQEPIKSFFSSYRLIKIFQNDKRILYHLLKVGLISIEERMTNSNFWISIYSSDNCDSRFKDLELYPNFFEKEKYIEIPKEKLAKFFLIYSYPLFSKSEHKGECYDNLKDLEEYKLNTENIDEFIGFKLEVGENEDDLCQIIRNDLIEDFQRYLSKTNLDLSMKIKRSFFETNQLLIENQPSLIEYAAFFGSVKIFKFLYMNHQVEIKPDIIKYATHGMNYEIIHLIEDKKELFDNIENSMELAYIEAQKCYDFDLIEYYAQKVDFKDDDMPLSCYNFSFFPESIEHFTDYFDLFKYNYATLYSILKKETRNILNHIFKHDFIALL